MIVIDYRDGRPIYEQIVHRFQEMILKGAMAPDERMPSIRTLAIELAINPNTIQKAYTRLEQEGFIYSVKGKGNFVAYSESLREKKREDIMEQFLELVKKAMELGVSKEDLIETIRSLKGGNSVDRG